jgi:hypothetical protein
LGYDSPGFCWVVGFIFGDRRASSGIFFIFPALVVGGGCGGGPLGWFWFWFFAGCASSFEHSCSVMLVLGAVDGCRGLRRSIGLSRRRYCSPTPVFRRFLLLFVGSHPGDHVCSRLDEFGDTVVSADREGAADGGRHLLDQFLHDPRFGAAREQTSVQLGLSAYELSQWFVLAERCSRECSQEPGRRGAGGEPREVEVAIGDVAICGIAVNGSSLAGGPSVRASTGGSVGVVSGVSIESSGLLLRVINILL